MEYDSNKTTAKNAPKKAGIHSCGVSKRKCK